MKKLILALALIVSGIGFGQTPQKINYQAVIRDASGASITNTTVGVRISIVETSETGPQVFVETHSVTTNSYGLMNLKIGEGTPLGAPLNTIDWSADNYYVVIDVDPAGGTNYTISMTSQLVSVPYALHAETVTNNDDADADPLNETNTLVALNGTVFEITDANGMLTVDLASLIDDADADATNELQTISKAGSTVTLSNGGGSFTDEVDDADADPTNEYNTGGSLSGATLTITDGGGPITVDLTSLIDDADADPNNEIQTISKTGSTVTLSNSGGSFTDEVDDADADASNELQTISKAGSTVTLSNGGGSFTDEVDDADADASNELQTISKAGSTVTLSNGGGSFTDEVDDADADASNELITNAQLSGTDLEITENGTTHTVDLSSLSSGGTTYRVGQHHEGGIIVWVDSTGQHGLIAGLVDIETSIVWDGTDGTTNANNIFGANYDASSKTDGATNTAAIYAHFGSGSAYAARSCAEYSYGGYTDWYLPSIFELQIIMQNMYVLGNIDIYATYWSSTEELGSGLDALTIRASDNLKYFDSQVDNFKVRPMRRF